MKFDNQFNTEYNVPTNIRGQVERNLITSYNDVYNCSYYLKSAECIEKFILSLNMAKLQIFQDNNRIMYYNDYSLYDIGGWSSSDNLFDKNAILDSTIPIIVREITAVPKIANYLTENNIEFDVESLSLSEDFDIKWFINYDKNRELVQKTLPLTVEHIIKDEYYPAITKAYNTGIDEFIGDFLQSSENVLVLTGLKGSGKTELIRHIGKKYNSDITLTFNEEIMQDSSFYYDFLTSKKSNLMVIEDADKFLGRRTDGNPVMQMFLNLTDGLVTNNKKKFIFSTICKDLDVEYRSDFKTLADIFNNTKPVKLNKVQNKSFGFM